MSILNIARTLLYPIQANIRSICIRESFQKLCSERSDDNEGNSLNNNQVVANYDDGDRSEVVDYETSVRYLESDAYKSCYGDHLVWELYRRRGKHGRLYLVKTRQKCISKGKLTSSSPCPICRDKYLVLDYRHVKLLNQFISSHYEGVLPTRVTGLCQEQQKKLMVEVMKAKEYGTISYDIPCRMYNYEYFHKTCLENLNCN